MMGLKRAQRKLVSERKECILSIIIQIPNDKSLYTWILIIDNFVQIDIFLAYMMGMGRRQVVRHRTLTPLFVGSIPTAPAYIHTLDILLPNV